MNVTLTSQEKPQENKTICDGLDVNSPLQTHGYKCVFPALIILSVVSNQLLFLFLFSSKLFASISSQMWIKTLKIRHQHRPNYHSDNPLSLWTAAASRRQNKSLCPLVAFIRHFVAARKLNIIRDHCDMVWSSGLKVRIFEIWLWKKKVKHRLINLTSIIKGENIIRLIS